MRKNTIPYLIGLCVVLLFSGCSLEEPRAVGERCEALYIQLNSGEIIKPGENSELDYYFAALACPPDVPFCRTMNGEAFCSARKETCPNQTHLFDGDCEPNTVENCGKHGNNCLDNPGWYRAECNEQAVCVATDCHDGYTLRDNSCESADQCCGEYCNNCTLTGNLPLCSVGSCVSECPGEGEINCGGSCIDPQTSRSYCGSDKSCTPRVCDYNKNETCIDGGCTCPTGYNRCANDVCTSMRSLEHCGDCDNDCTAIDGWRDGSCNGGECVLRACLPGYHIVVPERGARWCEADTVERCGVQHENCLGLFDHYDSLACVNGMCKVERCLPGYFLYEGLCIESSGEQCGSVDNICGPHQHCDRSTSKCVCDSGYTDCSGVCYDLNTSATHCNSCDTACSVDFAQNSCDEGTCVFSCTQGYVKKQDGTGCEPFVCDDGQTKCDGLDFQTCENNAWKTTETCSTNVNNAVAACDNVAGCGFECKRGYTDCDGTCYNLLANKEHCGVCTVSCSVENASNSCSEGHCGFDCNDGFHEFGSVCEPDDELNCGSHGNACSVSNAQNHCEHGQCTFTCNEGFHYNDTRTACLGDNLDNCGGSVCGRGKIPNGAGFECRSGVCTVTDCDAGYHVFDNTCEEDSVTNCGEHNKECTVPDNAVATCSGTCGFTCNSGYTGNGSKCIENARYCTSVNATRCVNVGSTGKMQKCVDNEWTDQNTCSGNASCNSGGTACGSCVNGAVQCSDRTPQLCSEGSWTGSSACESGKICASGNCSSCGSNQHVFGNICEDNDVTNCGSHGNGCPPVGNGTAICSGGSCSFSCDSGYTSNGSGCVANSVYCSSIGDKRCSGRVPQTCTNNTWTGTTECGASEICSGGVCQGCGSGKHVYGNTCEPNDYNHCGSHTNSCSAPCGGFDCDKATGTCYSTGVCADSCHLSGSSCVQDECTSGAKRCNGNTAHQNCVGGVWTLHETCSAPSNATPVCDATNGCDWSCYSGYDECNGGCISFSTYNTSNDHCGGCGVKCNSSTKPGSTGAKCVSGVCVATGCQSGYYKQGNDCVPKECSGADVMVEGECLPAAMTCIDKGVNPNYSNNPNITCFTRDTCNVPASECFDFTALEYCENLEEFGHYDVYCGGGMCNDWNGIDCFVWEPCYMGEHTYNNACEPDSVDNCGRHGYKCPAVEHGTVGCGGTCYVESCEIGYHISDSWPETCERDEDWCDGDLEYCHGACIDVFWDNNNCGGCDVKCAPGGMCEDGSCIGGWSIYQCGDNGIDCTKIYGWLDGECRDGECHVTQCKFEDQTPVYDRCLYNFYTCIDWGYQVPPDSNGNILDLECFSLEECEDPNYANICVKMSAEVVNCGDPNYTDLVCVNEEACQRENLDPGDCYMWLYPYSVY